MLMHENCFYTQGFTLLHPVVLQSGLSDLKPRRTKGNALAL